jgi:glycerol uptake facilitator protein
MERTSLRYECLAEFIGTYILVFFGVGSVHTAVLLGGQQGIWQVGVVWAVAISLAIYAVGAVSGAHINPAITVSFSVFRRFPVRKVPFYVLAQLAGAFAAAATLYGLFHNVITAFEMEQGITRGAAGSELTAMLYGEYFPNPAMIGARFSEFGGATVTHVQAVFAEGIGTAFLAFFVHAVTDARNPERPHGGLFAPFIGLTVAIVISIVAPLTQAGLNPARDFGPRLFALCAGWGRIALPGPGAPYGFFTVYILAPIVGAVAGSAVYNLVVRRGIILVNDADDDKPLREEEHENRGRAQ